MQASASQIERGATPLAVVEETVAPAARRIIGQPGGRDFLLAGLRDTEAKVGEKYLPAGEDSQVTDQQVVEAFSRLGVAMFTGAARPGNLGGLSAEQRRTARESKLGRLLDAFAVRLSSVFGRVGRVRGPRARGESHRDNEAGMGATLAKGQQQNAQEKEEVAVAASALSGHASPSALDTATISAEGALQGGGSLDVSANAEAASENPGSVGVASGKGAGARASQGRFVRPSRRRSGGLAQSRAQGTGALVAVPEARGALDTIRQRLPALLHQRVLAFDTPADLAASSYGEDYSDAEIASMEGAEALFDRHTKRTLLFLGQVEQRPGETPLAAVGRVLVHERMGHEGVNFLLETDAEFAARWNKLVGAIPQVELDAIVSEPGYAHLEEQPQELALEWMARQIEASEGPAVVAQLNGQEPGLAQRMWQAMRDALTRLLNLFSGEAKFDLELNDLIRQAREAALDGRTASQLTAELDRRAAELEVRSPLPEVIRLASPHNPDILLTHEDDTGRAHQDRNPGRAFESVRRGAVGAQARRRGKAGRVPGGSERRSRHESPGLPRVHAETLEGGIASLKKFRGVEHDVYQHLPSNLAIKLTRPGEFGWGGNIQAYLRRLAWTNLLFDDDITVAGLTQFAGESLPRLVTTQPWYAPDENHPHPNAAEIQAYMRAKGFLKVADEGYVHEYLDIFASDAKPDNFIRTEAGLIRPIDLILGQTDEQEYRRLRDLVEKMPQMPGPARRQEKDGRDNEAGSQAKATEMRLQFSLPGSRERIEQAQRELDSSFEKIQEITQSMWGRLPARFQSTVEALMRGEDSKYPGIEAIRPRKGLDRESRIVEASFAHYIAQDPERALQRYFEISKQEFPHGRYIGPDAAREVLPEYSEHAWFRTAFNLATLAPSGYIAYRLAMPTLYADKSRSVVLFTAGGYASGKTMATKLALGKLVEAAAAVVDSTVSSEAAGSRLIEGALGEGFQPAFVFVYRPWLPAYRSAVSRLQSSGRPIGAAETASAHYESQKAFLELAKKYHGKATFFVLVNDGALEDIRREPVEYLEKHAYYKADEKGSRQQEMADEYAAYLDGEFSAGRLGALEYTAARFGKADRRVFDRLQGEGESVP